MPTVSDIKTLKKQVAATLEKYPQTRNSDKKLTIYLWLEFYPQFVRKNDRQMYIPIDYIMDLPSQDGIKRVRAHIQNTEKRLLPTSLEVALERGWLEDDWKKAMGYWVEPKEQFSLWGIG